MRLVLDASVHVYAAGRTGVALDPRLLVHDPQLVTVRGHCDLVPRGHADEREQRALGLPALAAAADVIECRVVRNANAHWVVRTPARENATGETSLTRNHPLIDSGMNRKWLPGIRNLRQ